MEQLKIIFKTLGIPLGFVAVIIAVLSLVGVDVERITIIAASLVGAPACIAILIDVLKWTGAVRDDTSGTWSALINLIVLAVLAVMLRLYPQIDIQSADMQLADLAQVIALALGYIGQVVTSKQVHAFAVNVLGVRVISYTAMMRDNYAREATLRARG